MYHVGNVLLSPCLLYGYLLRDLLSSTVEDEIILDPVESPEIIDDFEFGQEEAVEIKDKEVNKQKLRRRFDQYKVILILHM